MRNYQYNESMSPPLQMLMIETLALLGLTGPTQLSQFPYWYHLIAFFVNLIVLTLTLYVAGLVMVGEERTKLSRAFKISFLGTLINSVLNLFFILLPVSLSWEYALSVFRRFLFFIVWLSLIKNFYRTGWLGAFAVAILALVIMIVLELLLIPFLIGLLF